MTKLSFILLLALVCGSAIAQTTRQYPPLDDLSLVNHQPWADAQLINPSGYLTLTPSGADDYPAIQAALDNSAVHPVMLRGGDFLISRELKVPPRGIIVAENGLDYLPYAGSVGNARLIPTGAFVGTAAIAFNGTINPNHYGVMRGILVDDNYVHFIAATGYIVGTTMTISTVTANTLNPGFVPFMTLQDTAGLIVPGTKVTAQLTGMGGVGTYSVLPSQTVGSSGSPVVIAGVIHGFENLGNASFTTMENFQAVRMTGDGYNITADGSQSGGQSTNGIIRPVITGFYSSYNMSSGIKIYNINSSFASDVIISGGGKGINAASNGNNTYYGEAGGDLFLFGTTGQISDIRTEQDGNCGIDAINSSQLYITNFFSDTNGCHIKLQNSTAQFTGGGTFQRPGHGGGPAIFLANSNLTANGLSIAVGGGGFTSTIQADSTSTFRGWFDSSPVYVDVTTAGKVEPYLQNTTNSWTTLAISGSTFTPDFTGGKRNFEIDLSHSACPCTLANPAWTVPGIGGVFKIVQSASGSDLISTYGTSYYASTKPTLSSAANAPDIIPWTTDSNGKIIFGSPVYNAH